MIEPDDVFAAAPPPGVLGAVPPAAAGASPRGAGADVHDIAAAEADIEQLLQMVDGLGMPADAAANTPASTYADFVTATPSVFTPATPLSTDLDAVDDDIDLDGLIVPPPPRFSFGGDWDADAEA